MRLSEFMRLLQDAENEFGEIDIAIECGSSFVPVKKIYFVEEEDGRMRRLIVIEPEIKQ
jgi:hypothetical protein